MDSSGVSYLGSGAHWIVYRLRFEKPGFEINGVSYLSVAQKIPKYEKWRIQQNVESFQRIQKSGIPTLSFFASSSVHSIDCILCEDLGTRERLFVSPNTARSLPDDESRMIKSLQEEKTLQKVLAEEEPPSIAEHELKTNKVQTLANFDGFIDTVDRYCDIATRNSIGLCEDMFFFGVKGRAETDLELLIGDFDTVLDMEGDQSTRVKYGNRMVGISSLWEFVDQFVADGTNKKDYFRQLEAIGKEYRKKSEGSA